MKNGKIVAAVVGLGACGSAMAEAALTVGLGETFILNSSAEDLDAISMVDRANKFKFGSINGAAKNRKVAFNAFKNEHAKFLQALEARLLPAGSEVDIIFMFASAGGGTGSGILPIAARILQQKFPQISIVPVVALPDMNERGIAQQNALDCLRELDGGNFCTIIVDNNRIDSDLILAKYDEINKETVENIKHLISFDKVSRISNIDIADRLSMFTDPGVLVIANALVDPTEKSPIKAAAKRALDASPMCAKLSDGVKRVAIQCELQKEMYTQTNITEAHEIFVNAAGIYEGYYEPDMAGETAVNKVLVAVTGAKLDVGTIRARESAVDAQFKKVEVEKVDINAGNSALKDSWSSSTKTTVSTESSDNFDSLFDDVGSRS